MNDSELLENVKTLLCNAIAARLKITKTNYATPFDAQTAVKRFLTNIMSLGYNKGDIDAVLEELCTARHFGDENNEAVINAMRKEVVATQNQFGAEIAAFAKMHELNQAGAVPETTWAQIQAMVVLSSDRN